MYIYIYILYIYIYIYILYNIYIYTYHNIHIYIYIFFPHGSMKCELRPSLDSVCNVKTHELEKYLEATSHNLGLHIAQSHEQSLPGLASENLLSPLGTHRQSVSGAS